MSRHGHKAAAGLRAPPPCSPLRRPRTGSASRTDPIPPSFPVFASCPPLFSTNPSYEKLMKLASILLP
ncbi:hypothetical protein E2562_035053 [Oryza meyeriana var. granulata]|uniref:Uncharacterized protein n=1 Tax=Oryza meyeriana var. granulata TaxID=110450 RepID=A0A6G1CMC8_9ORYZ|nr:hypothetical protein E2562_035053 [Oryza meyeriana var. granulata]